MEDSSLSDMPTLFPDFVDNYLNCYRILAIKKILRTAGKNGIPDHFTIEPLVQRIYSYQQFPDFRKVFFRNSIFWLGLRFLAPNLVVQYYRYIHKELTSVKSFCAFRVLYFARACQSVYTISPNICSYGRFQSSSINKLFTWSFRKNGKRK